MVTTRCPEKPGISLSYAEQARPVVLADAFTLGADTSATNPAP
ncbi:MULTISPECIES: hypothetical protein [Streptomyces]|uniref:Uncharacterized protein n=1 Tax=Streptomyces scabiei (strain 87.22) TaxID=680198 RepID=C9Z297_STRSW|nr:MULTISPECIES: hypothetical protein [Streptomyces]MDW8474777.1 hypothetical protein [Streptomyces scabiei]MDX2537140.1 hypothetical protein [Streptomyces scabiei]MDX2566619.1 hypothetical protein [Streptomyces scabiei]MDX2575514.1 hypothetical protein [Streptomyces scabiei]MDX2625736.1 hypothetical protein [Streptomyces scabiei]